MNSKAIRSDYEALVLIMGYFDELAFLDKSINNQIGTQFRPTEFDKKVSNRQQDLGPQLVMPPTPLSGRQYLGALEKLHVTPVSKAALMVAWLVRLIGSRESGPSSSLAELFQMCQVTRSFGYWSGFRAFQCH